jgi:hypothetical protein
MPITQTKTALVNLNKDALINAVQELSADNCINKNSIEFINYAT